MDSASHADVVNRDDITVCHRSQHPAFVQESLGELRSIGKNRTQDLDRNRTLKRLLHGTVYLCHAALTNFFLDLIASDFHRYAVFLFAQTRLAKLTCSGTTTMDRAAVNRLRIPFRVNSRVLPYFSRCKRFGMLTAHDNNAPMQAVR